MEEAKTKWSKKPTSQRSFPISPRTRTLRATPLPGRHPYLASQTPPPHTATHLTAARSQPNQCAMGSPSASTTSPSSSSSSSAAASSEETHTRRGVHVLLLPVPGAQGHTNPMLQFGRRLVYHGLRPTLVTTRYVLSTTARPPPSPFRVAAISDGFNDGGMAACPDLAEYCRRLEAVGSETLAELLRSEAAEGRPVRVLVYDPHLPWARRVARAAGVAAAAFLSQPCSVDLIYGELSAGRLALPVTDGAELSRRGLLGVELGPDDVPPFAAKPDWCPAITQTLLRQFEGLEDADDVLVNSFRDIEPKVSEVLLATCLLFCSRQKKNRVLIAHALPLQWTSKFTRLLTCFLC
jgi:hypothetical protein